MPSGQAHAWPDEPVQILRQRWTEGYSASQISRKLAEKGWRYSRCAVIGKVHRLGLCRRGASTRPIYRKPTKRLSPSQRRKFSPRINPTPNYTPQPRLEAELRAIAALPPIDPTLDVLRLSAFTCRYPIGDPQDASFAFCGRTCDAEDSYCASHRRLCYQPAKPRARREPDELRRWVRLQGVAR